MKTIAERAKEAGIICQYKSDYRYDKRSVEFGYTQGATEQKAIDEEMRLKKCDDMTKEEHEREVAFAEWYNKNGKGAPTFSDAIEWARRELIDDKDNELHPIEITKKILKANRWKVRSYTVFGVAKEYKYIKDYKGNHLQWSHGTLAIWLDYEKDNDGVYADIIFPCKYVHQLQQVLRLAGMTDMANNFKI